MKRNFLFKSAVALCFVAIAVLWLLSELNIIQTNLTWLLAIFCFAMGAIFILRGLFSKTITVSKKFWIILGAGMIIAGFIAIAGYIVADNLVLPIIAIIITVAILLCVFASGGKKWDSADNE